MPPGRFPPLSFVSSISSETSGCVEVAYESIVEGGGTDSDREDEFASLSNTGLKIKIPEDTPTAMAINGDIKPNPRPLMLSKNRW